MGQLAAGVALIVAGSLLGIAPVVLLGLVLVLAEAVRQLAVRRGLGAVEYARRLPQPRGTVGDELPLDVTIWNRGPLPLSWVRALDEASAGVAIHERALASTDAGDALANGWTLAPYERVTRHFHVLAENRGVFALGPVHLEIGDLLARSAVAGERLAVDRWLVRPRSVPVTVPPHDDEWGGERRARRGLIPEPTSYAGVRPYQPGDTVRSIHWRASARLGEPVVRRFEPARRREILLVLDLQTIDGRGWAIGCDEELVETLCVAAASLIRRLAAEGAAVGLAVAGYAGAPRPFAIVPPSAARGQVGRCLDVLARVGSLPSAQLGALVTATLRALGPGTPLLVVGSRDPVAVAPALRRIQAAGHPVRLVAVGPDADRSAARARTVGLDALVATLDGPWRTATAMAVS